MKRHSFITVILFAALTTTTYAYDNGAKHSKLPPLGWSSWVALGPGDEHPIFDYCDEDSVKAAIDAFVSPELGLFDAGYRHFHLDDCWAGGRNSTGYLYPEKNHFPNGMKVVVDYAHSKNVVFGLYTCAGTFTCVGGRPGSKDHWEQDANVFAEWGVDWVKMDWCNTNGMKPQTTYPKMSKAMNSTGWPMHFNMCEWGLNNPWEWGDSIAQSWRMSGDHEGIWSSTKNQIQLAATIPSKYSGKPYGWNDMDMLETGNYAQAAHANGKESNMTSLEYKTEFSMWAIAASPLVVTTPIMKCDKESNGNVACIPTITELQKEILLNTEILAINQDITPQGRPCTEKSLKYWARKLSNGDVAVALYNEKDEEDEFSFQFEWLNGGDDPIVNKNSMEFNKETKASVRDLWKHEDLGEFVGSFPGNGNILKIPAHGTVILRLTKH
eukprot:g7.t1